MFSALVVTLREGVEAALIVGITLVYLSKIGRPELRRTVYTALIAALIGSVAGAVALSYAPVNQDEDECWILLVAVVFGVMFVKGSVRIDLRKFFRVTTVILFFVAAQLVISGLHELSESGVLPPSKREMAVIGPIVRNDFFFPVTMLALVALMILF